MNSSRQNKNTTTCDSEPQTVLDHVEQLYKKVDNIEKTLGSLTKKSNKKKIEEPKVFTIDKSGKSGIDVVLGGQWGDEGKGKLVDILSQVGVSLFLFVCFRWNGREKTYLFARNYATTSKCHPFTLLYIPIMLTYIFLWK